MKYLLTYLAIILSGLACVAQEPEPANADDPIIAEVLGQEIRASQQCQLKPIIKKALLKQYAEDNGIKAMKCEINAFITKSEARKLEQKKRWKKEQLDLLQQLGSEDLSETKREQLTCKLETLTRRLKVDPEMEHYKQEHSAEVRIQSEEIAKTFIQTWKINRALFEQYGGRVIFEHLGPEPLDAYRTFIHEQEEKGAFQILDETCKAEFWHGLSNEESQTVYSAEDVFDIMNAPWWMAEESAEK